MSATGAPLLQGLPVLGLERNWYRTIAGAALIGQIKLTRIHVALLSLPGVRVKQAAGHLFTMSKDPAPFLSRGKVPNTCSFMRRPQPDWKFGGADRDRTDDLKLAKLPLSQLSYGPMPILQGWWARVDSNYRPHAYQACALTT
jgi:hypothetical protein